jgi:putative flippase GtrA
VKLNSNKSASEFIRYLLVGGFNTVFGFTVFALLNRLFRGLGSFSYMYAWAVANFIAITAAFLAYKWFVFRTQGNYLREWIRCFSVYGSGMIFGLVALPILVTALKHTMRRPELASYLAVAMLTTVTVILSFFGHKTISFRQRIGGGDSEVRPDAPPADQITR